ncbi:hypothetical protein DFH28DRAFT_932302 [Melampsora americana]|nr:hypothetical protein DFH28DRAFT_932302 [Melampsora americana]
MYHTQTLTQAALESLQASFATTKFMNLQSVSCADAEYGSDAASTVILTEDQRAREISQFKSSFISPRRSPRLLKKQTKIIVKPYTRKSRVVATPAKQTPNKKSTMSKKRKATPN